MNRSVAIIPARYASTRFPGKVLVRKTGKYLIQHVWEQVSEVPDLDETVIATDDERVREACDRFGARVVMTSPDHVSGSDRVAEAAASLDADLILNVQGDEPEIDPTDLERLLAVFDDPDVKMATLAVESSAPGAYRDPNVVKVVTNDLGNAQYFSRSPIPHGNPETFLKHQGVYAFRKQTLNRFTSLPPTELEKVERLEQLRALAAGIPIRVVIAHSENIGIDTPEEYEQFVERYLATVESS